MYPAGFMARELAVRCLTCSSFFLLLVSSYPTLTNLVPGSHADSAIVDYIDDDGAAKPRHIFRLCAMGEKPIPVPRNT